MLTCKLFKKPDAELASNTFAMFARGVLNVCAYADVVLTVFVGACAHGKVPVVIFEALV